jgi:hypothetical protein
LRDRIWRSASAAISLQDAGFRRLLQVNAMYFNSRRLLSGALIVGAVLSIGAIAAPRDAAAAGAVAPFCISSGGGGEGGGYRTSRCEFFDYQKCLEAATGGSNCVQNIDYHGDASTAPAATHARKRR